MVGADADARYIPMGMMDDEGIGFVRIIGNWVGRVVVLGEAKWQLVDGSLRRTGRREGVSPAPDPRARVLPTRRRI